MQVHGYTRSEDCRRGFPAPSGKAHLVFGTWSSAPGLPGPVLRTRFCGPVLLASVPLGPSHCDRLIELVHRDGLYLPEIDLWFDPPVAKARAFVSHAHTDHFARHEAILCSDPTGILLQRRFRVAEERLERIGMHQSVDLGGFRLRVLPAGHIAGSAMLHLTRLRDNATLLYTGDFKMRRSHTCEPVSLLAADTLVMETTFGLPEFVFPPALEVESKLTGFAYDAFADGHTPVLCGYTLGKAQELVAILTHHGIPTLQHPAVAAMTEACREAGIDLPPPVICEGCPLPGHAVVAPPSVVRSSWLRGILHPRTALATGWALQQSSWQRQRAQVLIPLSDHADHPGLLECIQRVRPRRVLTVHGFSKEFAAELRSRGIDAWCASGTDQLELPISSGRTAAGIPSLRHSRALCPLASFTDMCRLVSETHSHTARQERIAHYLGSLRDETELLLAVRWLAGEPMDQPTKLAPVIIRKAVGALPGARADRCHAEFKRARDPVQAVRHLLQEIQLRPQTWDLKGMHLWLDALSAERSTERKIKLLTERLATLHPAESETLLRLLTGRPVSGADLATVAAAVAHDAESKEFQRAWNITGSLAETAVLARQHRLGDAAPHLFRPIVPMQAEDATAPPSFLAPWWVEPAIQGLRIHLHLRDGEAALMDIHCRPVTHRFPALARAAGQIDRSLLADGVIVGATPWPAPEGNLFATEHPAQQTAGERLILFDLLSLGGCATAGLPLRERHHLLAGIPWQEPIETIRVANASDPTELSAAHALAVNEGHGGVIAKDPASRYTPGTAGDTWLRYRQPSRPS